MRFLSLVIVLLLGCDSDASKIAPTPDLVPDSREHDMRKEKDAWLTPDLRNIDSRDMAEQPFEPGQIPTQKLQPKLGELTFTSLNFRRA